MILGLTPLLYVLGPAAVLVVMAVVFAESGLLAGFFLPGDSLLFLAGALVASHVVPVPVWLLLVGVWLAAVLGDQVGYLVGRRYGPRLFSRPGSRWLSPRHVERAHVLVRRHGPLAVVLGRFVPVLRTLVPAVAGVGRMRWRAFSLFNVLGAVGWGTAMVLAGVVLGGVPLVAAHIELFTVGLVALSLVPAASAGGLRWLRRRRPVDPGQPAERVGAEVAS